MKIVFMGTPAFALPTLANLESSQHEIVSVVTQPDRPRGRGREVSFSPVKAFAVEKGLPVLQPEKARAPEFIDKIRALEPDLIVVVAYGQILKQALLDIPRHFCMNLHSSLLPKYRGAAPINWAIINGDAETGVTTMKMDAGMDTGDMLLTKTVPIRDQDTAATLHDALAQAGGGLVLETIAKLEAGTLTPIEQDHDRATLAPKLKKEDGLIDWSRDAETLRNLVRGLDPWPGAFTFHDTQRLRICAVETAPGGTGETPGEIVRITDHGIEAATGQGRLVITELQPEGKKRMPVKSYLAGNRMEKGTRFLAQPKAAPTV